jgi:hypothetical protein
MLVAGLELSDQDKILAVKAEVQSKMLNEQEQMVEEGTKTFYILLINFTSLFNL